MAENGKATLLLKVLTNDDVAMALRRWPVLKGVTIQINDELLQVVPSIPMMPHVFAVMRGQEQIFGCTMHEAELK